MRLQVHSSPPLVAPLSEADANQWAASLEGQAPQAVLQVAVANFVRDELVLACSFQAEDAVLVDMLSAARPGSKVFYLDTGFHFPETLQARDAIAARYDIELIQVLPRLTPDMQAAEHGDALWQRDPDGCCGIRKVEPLARMLSRYRAWITGIRRDQAPSRAGTRLVEWDPKFGLIKFNPLAAWTSEQVWAYIREHQVPYNALHDQGYPSIGCTHCTRPVVPGQDPRAGRWAGFAKTECGLHPVESDGAKPFGAEPEAGGHWR